MKKKDIKKIKVKLNNDDKILEKNIVFEPEEAMAEENKDDEIIEQNDEYSYEDSKNKEVRDSLKIYFDEIRNEKVLTAKEEKILIRKAQKGDKEAREKVIKANLKLVVKIAKRYEYFGIPLIDLVEEGNMGLMKAIDKFKPSKGFKFSTYATWWIKQSINRAIANQRNTIRIPIHILDIYHKYLKYIEKELRAKNLYPSKEEIARKLKITPIKLDEILNIIKTPKSIDMEYENEDSDSGKTLKDVIENTAYDKPDEDFLDKERKEKILKIISNLKPKEQRVIIYRFGLNNDNVLTLEEIGKMLGITRERVRQIEIAALKKLRQLIKKLDFKI
ncbi:MAG: sigma-70 family RNA polymerase sigma factor [Candidatus Goldbacteria bacterium]|nr:sigma-70 family RNA polymerase sigma factor [Candidatus Goldiibacteriota bacterium]